MIDFSWHISFIHCSLNVFKKMFKVKIHVYSFCDRYGSLGIE